MKTHRFILVFLVLMLLPAAAQADDCYVIISGGTAVGIQIKSLPYTISSPGFYYIKQNLTCPAGSDGITINADDVTLDLMGFSLIGPGSGTYNGVNMDAPRSNVEIRNGSITNFGHMGIRAYSVYSKGIRVINVRTHDNGNTGIYVLGKSHHVKGCISFSNGYSGMFIDESSLVLNCTSYNNQNNGIGADIGSSIIESTSYDNVYDGIYGSGVGVSLVSNNSYSNGGVGIRAASSSLVKGNVSYGNDGYGISASSNCLTDL